MSFPRSAARLSALALASSVIAACGDSTSPLELDPDAFMAVGESIALEIGNSTMTLTAGGAMSETDPSMPIFSLGSPTSQRMLGGATYQLSRIRPAMQIGEESCGDYSQEIPTDTDEDGVPDNLRVTFRLPECRFVTEEMTMEMTGVMTFSDPTLGTPGFGLSFGMDNLRISLDDGEDEITVTQDGLETVTASAGGLSQAQKWAQAASISGFGGFGMTIDWTNTFTPAEGSSLEVGQPLPNGLFTPNGTIRYREGNRVAALVVETAEALAYDMECAALHAEDPDFYSPFADGEVHVAFSGEQGQGYVRIRYLDCTVNEVLFIGNQVL